MLDRVSDKSASGLPRMTPSDPHPNRKRKETAKLRQARADYVNAPYGAIPAGECGFCGFWDKRHRMWDMIGSRFLAGESIAELAKDYDYTVPEMEQWLRLKLWALTKRGKQPKKTI